MINYEHMWSLFQISNLWNVYENSKLDEFPHFFQQNGYMLNIVLSLSRCMLKFHEWSCFEEFECNVWGWTNFGATWHCTWVLHVILWPSHYSWWSNIWWLQCHKKIINNTFPMSWFFLSQWWKNVCIWHSHLLNISTMYINMTYLVLQNFSLSWKDLSK